MCVGARQRGAGRAGGGEREGLLVLAPREGLQALAPIRGTPAKAKQALQAASGGRPEAEAAGGQGLSYIRPFHEAAAVCTTIQVREGTEQRGTRALGRSSPVRGQRGTMQGRWSALYSRSRPSRRHRTSAGVVAAAGSPPWPLQASPPRPSPAWACAAACPRWRPAPTPLVRPEEARSRGAGERARWGGRLTASRACGAPAGHGRAVGFPQGDWRAALRGWATADTAFGLWRRRRCHRRRPLLTLPVPSLDIRSGGRPQVCQGPRVGEGGGRCGHRGHHRPRAGGGPGPVVQGTPPSTCRCLLPLGPQCLALDTATPGPPLCRASWVMWCTRRCPRWAPPSAPATAWPLWSRSRCAAGGCLRSWGLFAQLGFGQALSLRVHVRRV